jgi:soluble lytic murein transglycosylase
MRPRAARTIGYTRMFEPLREPRKLAVAVAASVLLVGTGFAIPTFMFGGASSPRVDALSTGSVSASVAMPDATPTAEPVRESVPQTVAAVAPVAPPSNLLMLQEPQTSVPAASQPALEAIEALEKLEGSAAFDAAMTVLREGEPMRAFELANELPDSAERRAVQWAAIEYGDGKVDYTSVIRFSTEAAEFAQSEMFKIRLEQALLRADAAGPEMIRVLGGSMPTTIEAQISLAAAYARDGQTERAAGIAKTIWIDNVLSRSQESAVLRRLGDLLTKDDHWLRAVNLMMHDRAQGVERLTAYMTDAQKSLAIARNAVSRNSKDAKKLLDAVDASMQSHPVYFFSRAQRARQFELWDDAVTWLNKAKGDVPEAAEWWYERRTLTRQLLAMGNYDLAFQAADGYRVGPDGRLVEAHFHAGWIALAFLDRPEAAVEHFEEMTKHSTLPDTVTQAHYWLGRARREAGDAAGAEAAFTTAAGYATVYYGQLARSELGTEVALRQMPDASVVEADFEARDTVKAVRLFAGSGETPKALTLLRSFAHNLEEGGELLLAARLAEQLGGNDLAILIAETAERKGFPLDLISFPDSVPTTMVAEVDHAAIFAVVRQESRFRVDAVSSAGARGLMQLMPGTAKETAAKVGLPYSKGRLTSDPAYNAMLGSTYLAAQLDYFDGSLVLAAAAYNAGPGNARKWIRAFGDPRSESIDPVTWVEMIPFQETRKYVQRVLGNYMVYRARFGHDEIDMLKALRHIS